ncbi:aldo/keto reductase [Sinimarinibacterium flocculans]|uniref:Aryl-alcohol dehydrogenase-like predicted oxidoreductase n=1 Tax=Sinimarinibacterium flocculans TaxID=985250 RepID=A0A318EKA7_9GAMM|nr:aldo/keto reductase [Sinimarinibacterium flocculans]PXV71332.1 aryl-alcohol dehydrogenase-like predicted oxidoreductase [Sinimarinibacterium flocculans]
MTLALDRYRLLGRSGLRVSPLALGTMSFGVAQAWGTAEAEARNIVDAYAEHGGNHLDTANFYAGGESERAVGRLVQGRRDRFVIATKYSLTTSPGDPNATGNHRKSMVQAVEDSLRRLRTDYIDLLYLHMWDGVTPVEEILRAFDDLVRAGKILYTGLSDTPAWQASRMQAVAALRGWTPFAALQLPYNLTERTVERELLPMAREMGMGVLPWSPLAGGVLSGKYRAQDLGTAVDRSKLDSRKDINLATGRLSERTLAMAEAVIDVAKQMDRSASQVALAWTLLHPAVTSPILGVRTLEQLEDNLGALELDFTDAQRQTLDAVSRIDPGFPHSLLNSPAMGPMFGNIRLDRH